jgi:hypothetical protein
MDAYDRLMQRHLEKSGRTDLSRRREAAQVAQRQSWGDLRPGQRSLNEPRND